MSATNRGAERQPDDFYETPAWCVRALLKAVKLPGGHWLEPAVGRGAIVKAVDSVRDDVRWSINDKNPVPELTVKGWSTNCEYTARGVFFNQKLGGPDVPQVDVVITNPPYSQALDFVKGALHDGKVVVMLLRLNWLGSKGRNEFLRKHLPSVYVLPKRPAFGPNAKHVREGKLDAKDHDNCEYAWFVWGLNAAPTLQVIDYGDCVDESSTRKV